MFPCFWTFTLLVWKDLLFRRSGNFAHCQDKNMHFLSSFTATAKWVWIDKYLLNMSCLWRIKIMCFTLCKDQFKPGKWKKSLKVKNVEVVNSAICAIFTLRHCKQLAAGRWGDFPHETFYFEIFPKTNVVSVTFGSRYNHGQSLKNIYFPTRNAVDRF